MDKKIKHYEIIYNDLFEAISEKRYDIGDRLPTEYELCEKYLVSRTTVKRALDNLVENGMVVRVSGKGSYVKQYKAERTFSKSLIGVVMCDISISYGLGILRSIEHTALKAGYSVIYKDSNFDKEKEATALKDLLRLGVDGIILQPLHAEVFNETVMRLSMQKKPVVILDRKLSGLPLSFVGSEIATAVKDAVRYLFGMGHRNICFVSSDPSNTTTIMERLLAFNNTFIEENIQNYNSNIYVKINSTREVRTTRDMIEKDIQGLSEYLCLNPQITCLFAAEYSIALICKQTLARLNKRIPDDVSLVTIDNVHDDFFRTNTSYIKQNEKEIGKKAVEIIQKISESYEIIEKSIPAEFIINRSVKKLN